MRNRRESIYTKDVPKKFHISCACLLNTSFTVSGSSIRVQFTSDSSDISSGATVSIASASATTPPPSTTPGGTTFSTGAYRNNENCSQTLSIPGATALTVNVSGVTESGYDFITIYDANSNQVKRLSGSLK